ncbi:unnamed protein product [Candida verbasci]|uniref:beta-glucosidase n=1 Tax=Candida verbasci TaxID=1227364 RepID=A0A9W4TVQ4_9ASCO|nr:unnamed protein product [Candida verbasci]
MLETDKLLKELTIDEKINLLAGYDFWHTYAIPRLDIPSISVSDGPNGVRGVKFFNGEPSTCFPCGTGLAASFNKELILKCGELMGKEAKLKKVNLILGPTCNILRSPLGGRGFESYSEDPYLSGIITSYLVEGIQKENILACLKHFVCNDQEKDRKIVNVKLTDRSFREVYLKPFQLAIKNSNPGSLMIAYNKVQGEYISESKSIIQDIVRDEWKYDGCLMSDWFGTNSAKKALDAGLNLEMPGPTIQRTKAQIDDEKVSEDVINENVKYVLDMVKKAEKVNFDEEIDESDSLAVARQIGDESIVLLKNDEKTLPLSKNVKSIAIIGPNAKASQESGGGSATLPTRYKTTPIQSIKEKLSKATEIFYEQGCQLDKNVPDIGPLLIDEFGKPGVSANFYHEPETTKDRKPFETINLNTSQIFLADFKSPQLPVDQALYYVEFISYFTPDETAEYEFGCSTLGTAELFVNDRLLIDNKTKQVKGDAFFLAMGTIEEKGYIHLNKGEKYQIKILFGTTPTNKLGINRAESGGVYFGCRKRAKPEEDLQKAIELSKKVDYVILCVGLSKEWETEGTDRTTMNLPGNSNKLIEGVCQANKNVILINQSGTPITMPWVNLPKAIVHAWYGGNELGNSIANVIFGDANPSGKLSMTWPKKLEDNPSYLHFGSNNGQVWYGEDVFVGYKYYEKVNLKPLYPFGFGLSYTEFEISNLNINKKDDNLVVTVDVKNIGDVEGSEVVQVYIAQSNPKEVRPVKDLKDFNKVNLKPNETKSVKFEISIKEATSYWNESINKWQSDKDEFKVFVGNSSDNISIGGTFNTEATFTWLSV